ncbi:hypothetical protein R6Q57_003292 [Mikania cordata]
MTVKRLFEDEIEIENMAMANCLMLLSRVGTDSTSEPDRLFRCKTCNKPFQSFQALGGHCASHKRSKLDESFRHSPPKSKTHECSICGQEFALGQALGGHMRRHRDETTGKTGHLAVKKHGVTTGLGLNLDLDLDLKLWPVVG